MNRTQPGEPFGIVFPKVVKRKGNGMDQRQSADLAKELAEAWVEWNNNSDVHENRALERSVRVAAFNQCFDFIPDGAVAAVVRDSRDLPLLAALAGEHLYLISVIKPGEGEGPVTTRCELRLVSPEEGTASSEVTYYGERPGPGPIRRRTSWTFLLGQKELTVLTHISPGSAFPAAEVLAQRLAKAFGWAQFPPDEQDVL